MTTNIPGHEGVGKVVKLGRNVEESMLGKRVGIKWIWSSCMQCEICPVDFTACGSQNNSGRNVRGTFQQYVVGNAKFVSVIPDSLPSELAAPLLCGTSTRLFLPSCGRG